MSFDVSWDIDKYREDHESDEHWQLRRNFIERWKESYPEERLICLARVFANMEFMGCRYPQEVMQEVARMSKEVPLPQGAEQSKSLFRENSLNSNSENKLPLMDPASENSWSRANEEYNKRKQERNRPRTVIKHKITDRIIDSALWITEPIISQNTCSSETSGQSFMMSNNSSQSYNTSLPYPACNRNTDIEINSKPNEEWHKQNHNYNSYQKVVEAKAFSVGNFQENQQIPLNQLSNVTNPTSLFNRNNIDENISNIHASTSNICSNNSNIRDATRTACDNNASNLGTGVTDNTNPTNVNTKRRKKKQKLKVKLCQAGKKKYVYWRAAGKTSAEAIALAQVSLGKVPEYKEMRKKLGSVNQFIKISKQDIKTGSKKKVKKSKIVYDNGYFGNIKLDNTNKNPKGIIHLDGKCNSLSKQNSINKTVTIKNNFSNNSVNEGNKNMSGTTYATVNTTTVSTSTASHSSNTEHRVCPKIEPDDHVNTYVENAVTVNYNMSCKSQLDSCTDAQHTTNNQIPISDNSGKLLENQQLITKTENTLKIENDSSIIEISDDEIDANENAANISEKEMQEKRRVWWLQQGKTEEEANVLCKKSMALSEALAELSNHGAILNNILLNSYPSITTNQIQKYKNECSDISDSIENFEAKLTTTANTVLRMKDRNIAGNAVKFRIYLKDAKKEILQEEILQLQNAIAQCINENDQVTFLRVNKHRGCAVVSCSDEYSRDWLDKQIPTLVPWDDAELVILNEDGIPVFLYAWVYVPVVPEVNSVLNPEDFLAKLHKQNQNVGCDKWVVLSTQFMGEGQLFFVRFDSQVEKTLHALGYKLNWFSARIKVKVKQKNKNAANKTKILTKPKTTVSIQEDKKHAPVVRPSISEMVCENPQNVKNVEANSPQVSGSVLDNERHLHASGMPDAEQIQSHSYPTLSIGIQASATHVLEMSQQNNPSTSTEYSNRAIAIEGTEFFPINSHPKAENRSFESQTDQTNSNDFGENNMNKEHRCSTTDHASTGNIKTTSDTWGIDAPRLLPGHISAIKLITDLWNEDNLRAQDDLRVRINEIKKANYVRKNYNNVNKQDFNFKDVFSGRDEEFSLEERVFTARKTSKKHDQEKRGIQESRLRSQENNWSVGNYEDIDRVVYNDRDDNISERGWEKTQSEERDTRSSSLQQTEFNRMNNLSDHPENSEDNCVLKEGDEMYEMDGLYVTDIDNEVSSHTENQKRDWDENSEEPSFNDEDFEDWGEPQFENKTEDYGRDTIIQAQGNQKKPCQWNNSAIRDSRESSRQRDSYNFDDKSRDGILIDRRTARSRSFKERKLGLREENNLFNRDIPCDWSSARRDNRDNSRQRDSYNFDDKSRDGIQKDRRTARSRSFKERKLGEDDVSNRGIPYQCSSARRYSRENSRQRDSYNFDDKNRDEILIDRRIARSRTLSDKSLGLREENYLSNRVGSCQWDRSPRRDSRDNCRQRDSNTFDDINIDESGLRDVHFSNIDPNCLKWSRDAPQRDWRVTSSGANLEEHKEVVSRDMNSRTNPRSYHDSRSSEVRDIPRGPIKKKRRRNRNQFY